MLWRTTGKTSYGRHIRDWSPSSKGTLFSYVYLRNPPTNLSCKKRLEKHEYCLFTIIKKKRTVIIDFNKSVLTELRPFNTDWRYKITPHWTSITLCILWFQKVINRCIDCFDHKTVDCKFLLLTAINNFVFCDFLNDMIILIILWEDFLNCSLFQKLY